MSDYLKHVEVLGTPVCCASYATAVKAIAQLAGLGRPTAVCAGNTHIVSLARHDSSFGKVMRGFDLLLPDGMPLIWSMNLQGAAMTDRVYGPYFMREALKNLPRPWKHFFFGGSQECLDALKKEALSLQPDLDLVGMYSPPFRAWSGADEEDFARLIREKEPDFIWVALGGERQERWISANLHRHSRGVFLAVGDAFELLAGRRSFAPAWMQKWGLTWLYRLWQEPRRLWLRYLRFNSLFLYYFILDRIRRGIFPQPTQGRAKPSIAFIGSRGVPARYSGFETVVEQLGHRLVERGYEVSVYNRMPYYRTARQEWKGMKIVWLPTIPTKSLDTIAHTGLSVVHALFCHYDFVYLCGVGNAPLSRVLRWFSKSKVLINVDGADYRRKKWGPMAKAWLRKSERQAVELADVVIADNQEVVKRYESQYGYRPMYLSYGAETVELGREVGADSVLKELGLVSGNYFLYVSRLTPENEADLVLKAFDLLKKSEEAGGNSFGHGGAGGL
ncbi:MAG: WecB/TagA/CpsF family glycosyltransferase [Blastochloris sp.]|nr:WecB/TagA/CpsF family glycosyltransferase [Blastochloris sp.]